MFQFRQRFGSVRIETPPPDVDTLEFLKTYKRVHIDADGAAWAFNPNAHLSPAWAQIRLESYAERWPLIGRTDMADPFCSDAKIFTISTQDGFTRKVADRIVPVAQTLSAFAGWNLGACVAFYGRMEDAANCFVEACENFSKDATLLRWRSYVKASAKFYAAGWLSYFFRMFVNQKLTTYAASLGVSQLHYDALIELLQRQTKGEDDAYQAALRHCALDVLPILQV
jgi:hypothetical protein